MKKGIRLVEVIALAMCLILSVIGCSGTKSTGSVTGTTAVGATSVTDTSVAQSEKLEKATIYVFIAASLKNSMTEIQEMYSKVQPNITIVYNADSSGTLKTQIEEGAACDVFFSAAMKQMTGLDDEGYIVTGSTVKLLQNEVVLIKPKGATTSVTGFENITAAKNIALAGEDVPVGAYAREIFTNLGIVDSVMSMEINEGANVSAVLAAITEGSNEIGVVYATDAASVRDKIDIIASAPSGSLKTPVVYPIGLVKNSEAKSAQTEAAKNFVTYIQSDECAKIFAKNGFSAVK